MRTLPRKVLLIDESRSLDSSPETGNKFNRRSAGVRGIRASKIPGRKGRVAALFAHTDRNQILKLVAIISPRKARSGQTVAPSRGLAPSSFNRAATSHQVRNFQMIHSSDSSFMHGPPGTADPPGTRPPGRDDPPGADPIGMQRDDRSRAFVEPSPDTFKYAIFR
jgi:hypothetical protein